MSGSRETRTNGPVPLALRTEKFSSLFLKSWTLAALFFSVQPLSIMKVLVRLLTRSGFGPFVLTCTVISSALLTDSTDVSSPFMSDVGCRARLSENTTSSASNAAPSWNLTFGRSLNSQVVGSFGRMRQAVASPATSSPFWLRATSVS
jgi:hypothetical protein